MSRIRGDWGTGALGIASESKTNQGGRSNDEKEKTTKPSADYFLIRSSSRFGVSIMLCSFVFVFGGFCLFFVALVTFAISRVCVCICASVCVCVWDLPSDHSYRLRLLM